MTAPDYYKVLGVPKSATSEDIKKTYKRLAKQYHPDRNPGDKTAENRFKEISEAYQVLSDPEKRKKHDMFGHPSFHGGFGRRSPSDGTNGTRFTTWSSSSAGNEFDFRDLFSQIFGRTGRTKKGTDGFTGNSSSYPGTGAYDFGFGHDIGPEPGRDVVADVTIPFEDAMKGGTHRFTIQRHGACSTCGGTGTNRTGRWSVCTTCAGNGRKQASNAGTDFTVVCSTCGGQGRIYEEPCPSCSGSGRASRMETVNVKIPPGVDDRGRLRIPGKGEDGPDGRSGDLYLRIHVTPHRYFRREGKGLHLDLPVTVSEAALGAKVEVPTLDGKATVKIPAGTQSGTILRLKGKGIHGRNGSVRGDMYVHILIAVPKSPDPRTKKILEELKQFEIDPRKGRFWGGA